MQKHKVEKVRRDVVRRTLTVVDKTFITPRMLRIRFTGTDLSTFESPSPDDHVKIFLTAPDGSTARRDFTPRTWDRDAGTMTLEFALHAAGPATEWALAATPGDTLEIGGPKGSTIVPDDFDWYLLVGDSCVLPSIARRLATLREGVAVFVVALVAGTDEEQRFQSRAAIHTRWVHESGEPAHDIDRLKRALQALPLPAGDGFVWIAGEAEMSRALYRYVVEDQGHPTEWVKASSYWSRAAETE